MALFLRQSTASQEVLLGPFLDDTDGKTAETGLTIANTDIKLWVTGATAEVSKNSGGATHVAAGRYYCVLDATDTATIGPGEINVHVAGALPVRREFTVLSAAVYDVLFGTTAPSTHTAAAVADAVWDEPSGDHTTNGTTGKLIGVAADLWNIALPGAYGAGTAGYLVGTNLDAAVSSRSTYAGGDTAGTTTLLSRVGTPTNLGGGATLAANLADIEAQTDDIGAAGAGLTAVPWNTAWDAEVQSECADALVAYDPPTNAEMEARTLVAASYATAANLATVAGYIDTEVAAIKAVTDNLATAIELDGSVYRFTTNALEQAPTGGGGTADWTADERTAIRTILGVPASGTTPDAPTAGALKVIDDFLDTEVAAILAAVDTEVGAIKAKTDNLPASPAATGDAMTLAADAVNATSLAASAVTEIQAGLSTLTAAGVRTAVGLASANLDTQLDAIPTQAEINAQVLDVLNVDTLIDGQTVVEALRIVAGVVAGEASGAGTGIETFVGLDGATSVAEVVVDEDGNRATVTYFP
jgi:hypothetical protein